MNCDQSRSKFQSQCKSCPWPRRRRCKRRRRRQSLLPFLSTTPLLLLLAVVGINRSLSSLNVRRLSSRVTAVTSMSSLSSRNITPTRPSAYYVPCNGSTKRCRPSSITHIPFLQVQQFHSSAVSTTTTTSLFSQNDATQSKLIEQDKSASSAFASNYSSPVIARHWFTQLLPEGWCVGVCTIADTASSASSMGGSSLLHSATLLHPDEYQWGLDNIASSTSRTSYYLGRMALRLSLDALLANMTAQDERMLCARLRDEIHSTAINKDSYGRPILPDIISGSISHKGGNAVGLARFRSSTWDNQHNILGNNHFETMDASPTIDWREECPILEDDGDTDLDVADGVVVCAPSSSTVRGIGIDLERVDARRGQRIERKVLTETEQAELGGLAHIGIPSAEEVVLRFSLKESVYKALHPILCQYIGFQEAEITPLIDGTAKVSLNLLSGSHERLGIVVRTASWRKMGDYFLTSASVGLTITK